MQPSDRSRRFCRTARSVRVLIVSVRLAHDQSTSGILVELRTRRNLTQTACRKDAEIALTALDRGLAM